MMKLLVFLHGTVTMHESGQKKTREERVRQVIDHDPSVKQYDRYIPIGNAVNKLKRWADQGVRIGYLSSRRDPRELSQDRSVLHQHGFPWGPIFYREQGETYQDVVLRARPDALVEDDCESLGGETEMCYPVLSDDAKQRITSIVVPEFSGIDVLPDDPSELLKHSL